MRPLKERFRFFCFVALLLGVTLPCGHTENSASSSIEQPRKSTAPVQNIYPIRSKSPMATADAQTHGTSNGVKKQSKKIVVDKNLLKPITKDSRAGDPMVLLELFPWVREINRWIPKRFSLAEHDILLDPNQIVIRHQFLNARAKRTGKNSVLTLTYAGTLGREMNTRLELPLFYSPAIGLFGWERYPFGNYTMTILRGGAAGEEIYLRALTRF